jgi:hypothetical protein
MVGPQGPGCFAQVFALQGISEDMAISFARNTKPEINKFYSTIPDA